MGPLATFKYNWTNKRAVPVTSSLCFGHPRRRPLLYGTALSRSSKTLPSRKARSQVSQTYAMVNVDVSPSVILGVGLIGAGVSLYQIRQSNSAISKDYDVVISCVSLLVGGILIFQGWRLDPLLLFGQLMTTGAAISFAVEALSLRSELRESQEKTALKDSFQGRDGGGDGYQLPPAEPWASNEQWFQQQEVQSNPKYSYSYEDQQYVEADYYDPADPYDDQPNEILFPENRYEEAAPPSPSRRPSIDYDEDW